MTSLFQIAQFVLGLMFYTVIGQAFLAASIGSSRHMNNVYLAMDKVVLGPKWLAQSLLPWPQPDWAKRALAAAVALVTWFAVFPKLAPILAYWGQARLEIVVASWLLLAVLLVGMALTVPGVWLRSFTRGLLALGLIEYANRLLIFAAERAGWIVIAPTPVAA